MMQAASSGDTQASTSAVGMARWLVGVSITKGAIVFAVTPVPRHSSAMTSLRMATPSLAIA